MSLNTEYGDRFTCPRSPEAMEEVCRWLPTHVWYSSGLALDQSIASQYALFPFLTQVNADMGAWVNERTSRVVSALPETP